MTCDYCDRAVRIIAAAWYEDSRVTPDKQPKNFEAKFCPNCGEPLAEPEPIDFETLKDMNDTLVYVVLPEGVLDMSLIIPSLVSCNSDYEDDRDEVYLTNNLGGRSTYDEVTAMGGKVYPRKPRQEERRD